MPLVRTTIRPDEPFEATEQEITDLRRQGLLIEDSEPAATPVVRGSKQREN